MSTPALLATPTPAPKQAAKAVVPLVLTPQANFVSSGYSKKSNDVVAPSNAGSGYSKKESAMIVTKKPVETKEEVLEHCAENLTNYKRPREVEFKDELPKTNVGKILRRALRDSNS